MALRAGRNGFSSLRPLTVLALLNIFSLLIGTLPKIHAIPANLSQFDVFANEELTTRTKSDMSMYFVTAIALVLLGGAFAGLTIAFMGQDEINLQVVASSGDGAEKKHAEKVLKLLKKGKHWVLVTLLLSNVITNETLPIVLDRSLGGGWPAVLSSTVLIVIFGEIVPQSVCVRYGLPIGAWMSPFVLALMWILAPVAWPTARVLDKLLGTDHGTTYKKAGLKTLVTLHKTLGTSPDERLNQDEVTIITAVLDLKAKRVGSIMTPMEYVFTMSADTILDEHMMDVILSAGYSRIPIYAPDNPKNFIGMLLVKMLITYDPDDSLRVRDFTLATLPETSPETSCLDIVNFFQEGKSHMVLVSNFPGEPYGALGVVTLEDVIEELIGEEIIDESDVFVDVRKAIRRITPAPRTKIPKCDILPGSVDSYGVDMTDKNPINNDPVIDIPVDGGNTISRLPLVDVDSSQSRKSTGFPKTNIDHESPISTKRKSISVPVKSNADLMQHLKHLGPSNAASRPKKTRISAVKIKPGSETVLNHATMGRNGAHIIQDSNQKSDSRSNPSISPFPKLQSDVEDLLVSNVSTVQQDYGTIGSSSVFTGDKFSSETQSGQIIGLLPGPGESEVTEDHVDTEQCTMEGSTAVDCSSREYNYSYFSVTKDGDDSVGSCVPPLPAGIKTNTHFPMKISHSRSSSKSSNNKNMGTTRSGSITENLIDLGGIRKIVLETNNNSDKEDVVHGNANGMGASSLSEDKDCNNSSLNNRGPGEGG